MLSTPGQVLQPIMVPSPLWGSWNLSIKLAGQNGFVGKFGYRL